ncbi:MAG: hypothetical protein LC776_19245 [Acidobacteria bacterium]|nr:hypothetical protein [Acidobacteriota bacterium]
MAETTKLTAYEDAVLTILAWEFSFTDIQETEAKIKRKLRAKKIGKYDQQRVNRLRRLKEAVQTEITKCHKSKYYLKSAGEFADMKDFDTLRMTEDFAAAFPEVPKQSIHEFVEYFIYLHYIR